ncbi:MAG: hypothetical protein MUC52_03445 [Candidatus Omnitrophica bacterium]|nr:hypothetical protein [Candidatus Omnitrophota bacterium]
MKKFYLPAAICTFVIAGCASPSYRQVFKEKPDANFRVFQVSSGAVYSAAA